VYDNHVDMLITAHNMRRVHIFEASSTVCCTRTTRVCVIYARDRVELTAGSRSEGGKSDCNDETKVPSTVRLSHC
jgi:hypothetical protein